MLVLSFKNGNNDPTRNSFERYYMPFVEIKYFNELINNRPFFDQPVKKQTRSIRKTYQNVKKWYLYNRKSIKLIISSKLF